ncbi:SMC family ATPase [Candidatus Dependentiae bacterium]|nr:SMC family ATPase [Candidatus Dependentiae bacterium]
MIPIKLDLKNFLSYGDSIVTIDFEDHALICLSGKNGNGKSALLDAITWALWGNARKVSGTAKADAGLMRLGQTRMMVSLEFFCNGQRYRVRRTFAKTYGKPVSSLDFELHDEKKEKFSSLSESTTRQTQVKIEKIVGLDFETFTNSAFLRQGQSNEFSQKTPKERKQILANILGLSRYDDLARLSLEYARKYSDERKVLLKVQEQAAQELEQKKEVASLLEVKKKEICELSKEIGGLSKKIEKKEKSKLELLQQKYQLEQVKKEQQELISIVGEKRDELHDIVRQWKTVHALSLTSPDIAALESLQKRLLSEEKVFREKQMGVVSLQELIVAKQETYQRLVMDCKRAYEKSLAEQSLVCEKAQLAQKQFDEQVSQKEKHIEQDKKKLYEAREKIAMLTKELVDYKAFQEEHFQVKAQFEKRRVFYQSLVQRGNWAQSELVELEQKKHTVQSDTSPSCPLCEQVLTIKRKQFLARTFVKQEAFYRHRLDRIKRLMGTLKLLLFEQHQTVQKLSLQDERFKQFQANLEALCKQVVEMEAEHKRVSIELDLLCVRKRQGEVEVAGLRKALEKKQAEGSGVELQDAQVKSIEKELSSLKQKQDKILYDKVAHDRLAKKLSDCEKKLRELDEFKSKVGLQDERKRSVSRLCRELKLLNKQSCVLDKKQKIIFYKPEQELELDRDLQELKTSMQSSGKSKEKLLQEKGSLENKIQRFKFLEKEKSERDKKIEQVALEAKEYQVLAGVFGKDGIQALLIEQAIPEVESEANSLLARLTDNGSQIFIESLRDLKKGGVKESLDIHISDSSGIRPYEMFSGGEAFRIDFALRIAISKLLARRAGTALQTLIIDEGFGSQDEDGLQRLMDAIHAIQKDFVKIIVVSHLPIFKDNFPVHFVIEKNSLGSSVRVEERG